MEQAVYGQQWFACCSRIFWLTWVGPSRIPAGAATTASRAQSLADRSASTASAVAHSADAGPIQPVMIWTASRERGQFSTTARQGASSSSNSERVKGPASRYGVSMVAQAASLTARTVPAHAAKLGAVEPPPEPVERELQAVGAGCVFA